MDKIRKKYILGTIEISAISLLTVALIIMFAQYCLYTSSSSSAPSYKDTLYAESIFAPFDDERNEKQLVSPTFVGVSFGKKLTPASPVTRNRLLSEILPFVSEVFSDVSTVLEFSSEASAFDYIENEISRHDGYIYLSFPCDIPAPAIPALLGAENIREVNHPFAVKDLYIFCDGNGLLSGICTDKNGGAATLNVRSHTNLSFDSLRSYTADGEDMTKFEFLVLENKKFPVFSISVSKPNITAYTETGDNSYNHETHLGNTLSSFGFNPNNTRFYRTQTAVTYVEQFGELTVYDNGDVLYTPESEGVPLSELCGKIRDNYSFTDKITAAYNILSSLDRNIYGGYAFISVDKVSYNNGLLDIVFSYYADGIKIESEKSAATLTFNANSLVFAEVNAKSFIRLDSEYSDIPQKLLFSLFKPTFDKTPPHSFIPVYTLNPDNGVYSAKHAFIFDSETEEAN